MNELFLNGDEIRLIIAALKRFTPEEQTRLNLSLDGFDYLELIDSLEDVVLTDRNTYIIKIVD